MEYAEFVKKMAEAAAFLLVSVPTGAYLNMKLNEWAQYFKNKNSLYQVLHENK